LLYNLVICFYGTQAHASSIPTREAGAHELRIHADPAVFIASPNICSKAKEQNSILIGLDLRCHRHDGVDIRAGFLVATRLQTVLNRAGRDVVALNRDLQSAGVDRHAALEGAGVDRHGALERAGVDRDGALEGAGVDWNGTHFVRFV